MTKTLSFENTVLTSAGNEIDFAQLPEVSIRALLSRGLTHYLGSEQASKVKAHKDKYLEEHKVELGEDEVAAVKADFVAKAIDALRAGTIGQRAVGITIDPLEKAMEKIAKQEVLDILRANGIKVPKKDEAVKFANGTEKTMDEMVAGRLAKNGEAIEKAAKKVLAEAKRKADALRVADASDSEALGF